MIFLAYYFLRAALRFFEHFDLSSLVLFFVILPFATMRFFLTSSLIAATTLIPSALTFPSVGLEDLSVQHDASAPRLSKRVVTSGASGATQPRLEIRQMQQDEPDQWTLLVLALAEWQKADQSDETGYYGVSSIHGVPRQPYDGVGQCGQCQGADGYCPHDMVLFPAWHRAYVALYEQNFIAACQKVAAQFTGSRAAAMKQAASVIRIPFWDWAAMPGTGHDLPDSISQAQITVNGPNGQETINNPLYSYHFTETSNLVYGPFTDWNSTLRYPNSNNADAVSNDVSATNAFDNMRANLQDQIWQLMSACNEYLEFSNDDSSSASSSCALSLEAIHNTVHQTAGGPGSDSVSGGHMTYLPLAAFDPVFWFHHANVDRYFALWQTLHPNSYGASQAAPHDTWTIAPGTELNANSPLTPFHKDSSGNFWTTNDVRDWDATFHYTYPEFVASDGSQDAIESYVAGLYGPSATLTAGEIKPSKTATSSSSSYAKTSSKSSSATSGSSSHATSSETHSSGSASSTSGPSSSGSSSAIATSSGSQDHSGPSSTHGSGSSTSMPSTGPKYPNSTISHHPHPYKAENGSQYEYVCNVHTPRYALNGSYTVYVFLDSPSSEVPSTWLTDSHLIGVVSVLAGGEMDMSHLISTGSVPLTRTLQKLVTSGALKNMSEMYCLPYLTQHLTWRIVKTNGGAVDSATIPGFAASVYSSTTSQKNPHSLPNWSPFVPQVGVTHGKPGGANSTISYPNQPAQQAPGYGSGSGSGSGSGDSSSENAVPTTTQQASGYGSGSQTAKPAPVTVTMYTTEWTTVCACQATGAF